MSHTTTKITVIRRPPQSPDVSGRTVADIVSILNRCVAAGRVTEFGGVHRAEADISERGNDAPGGPNAGIIVGRFRYSPNGRWNVRTCKSAANFPAACAAFDATFSPQTPHRTA